MQASAGAAALPLSYIPLALPRAYQKVERNEGTIAYLANSTSNPLYIDRFGLLTGLLLTFQGTMTAGGTAPVLTSSAPYSLIDFITLSVSGGVGRSINIPGYALNVLERSREPDYVDAPSLPRVISSANAWTFSLYVPVAVRDGDLYGGWSDLLGSIFCGDPDVTVGLTVTFHADLTSIFSTVNAATLTGNFTVTSFKLDTPTPDKDQAILTAISWTHQVIQEKVQPITGSGPLNIDLPSAEPRVYLKVLQQFFNNGDYANGILASLDVVLQNYLDIVQSQNEYTILQKQLRRYLTGLPVGNYIVDRSAGNTRQNWLPVERITLFRVVDTISGAALTNATVGVYSESMVPSPLARKWVGSWQAAQSAQAQAGGGGVAVAAAAG